MITKIIQLVKPKDEFLLNLSEGLGFSVVGTGTGIIQAAPVPNCLERISVELTLVKKDCPFV